MTQLKLRENNILVKRIIDWLRSIGRLFKKPGTKNIVKTSDPEWLDKAINFYIEGEDFLVIDDAFLGIEREHLLSGVALLRFAWTNRHVDKQKLYRILMGLGMTAIGVGMIAAAIADPEPTSKLGLLIAGGITLMLVGSTTVLEALGRRIEVRLKSPDGFEFELRISEHGQQETGIRSEY